MAELKQIYLDKKFELLTYFTYILYAVGILSIVVGVYTFIELMPKEPTTEMEAMQQAMNAGFSGVVANVALVVGVINGLLMIVMAQLISLFVNLEWNQRESMEIQKQILENMK